MNEREAIALGVAVLLAAGSGLKAADELETKYGVDVRMQRTGPRFEPPSVPGLAAWWRADKGIRSEAGRVLTWADANGQGHDLSAGGAEERPVLLAGAANGLPAVRFGTGPSGGLSPCVLSCRELSL